MQFIALQAHFLKELDAYAWDMCQSKSKKERIIARDFDLNYNSCYTNAFLELYLKRCKQKYHLAFIQFRKTVPAQD